MKKELVISAYRAGSEFIKVTRAENGFYYIHYGIGFSKYTGLEYCNCFCGGFIKYSDAIETLKKHRPTAEQIKTYCLKCKARQMLTYDPDSKNTEYQHCNGELENSAYTGCIYRNKKPEKSYVVCFIDGFDLKYKAVTETAADKNAAVKKVFETYGANFEHRLTGVYEK